VVVWCCDEDPGFKATRPQTEASSETSSRRWTPTLREARASLDSHGGRRPASSQLGQIAWWRRSPVRATTSSGTISSPIHLALGSINSPMQCMLKEICAQCLQPHRDPHTGKRSYVFSCFNQDQDLDSVDSARSRSASGRIRCRKRSPRSGYGTACRSCASNEPWFDRHGAGR